MNHAQFATLTRAWNHVGVYNPRTIARLARLGVDPEIAGTVAPNRRLWGANIEAGFISPDSFAAMTSRLHSAYVTTAKINGRKAAEQLDLFAARAPQKVAQGGFATDATKAYAADVRPELPARFPQGAPLIVSYGGGVDSTGVLVEFVRRGIRPDLILFADTGGEHPETYLYLDVMDAFLVRHGFPKITRVRKTVTTAEYDSLYSNCVSKAMLPSIAYGSHKHSCSLKWKVEPMDAYIRRNFPPVAAAVKNKRRIEAVRVIGYDAGPADVRRMERLEGETVDANVRWHYWYPLQEWGWDRERTLSEIVRAGLPPPPKSSCFFCPSTKPWELIELAIRSPDLAWQVIQMERAAGPNLDTLDGLWRAPVRGDADAQPRPGSMTEFLLEWMADGRAYAALPSLSAPGVSPTEVRASKVIGKVYRRRLPVAGQPRPRGRRDRGAQSAGATGQRLPRRPLPADLRTLRARQFHRGDGGVGQQRHRAPHDGEALARQGRACGEGHRQGERGVRARTRLLRRRARELQPRAPRARRDRHGDGAHSRDVRSWPRQGRDPSCDASRGVGAQAALDGGPRGRGR